MDIGDFFMDYVAPIAFSIIMASASIISVIGTYFLIKHLFAGNLL